MARVASTVLLCLLGSRVLAQGTLEQAEQAFDDLEVDKAQVLFRRSLTEPATQEERIRAFRGLGLCESFLGHPDSAEKSFESMLWLDPEAQVRSSLGPKVEKPFEKAKRALHGKRAKLLLNRDPLTGEVVLHLDEPPPMLHALHLHVEPEGRPGKDAKGKDEVRVAAPPELSVRAFGWAEDAARGTLFEEGSRAHPVELRPIAGAKVVEAQLPVAALTDNPKPEVSTEVGEGPRWGLLIGGVAAVLGAGVVAAVLTRPVPLSLPRADKTGTLP